MSTVLYILVALLVFGALDIPLGAASNGIIWLLDKASFFIPDGGLINMFI